jgi:hypothetical protein
MIFLEGGRVVDPATRVDGVRTVILDGGRIKEVREQGVSGGERSAHEAKARIRSRGAWLWMWTVKVIRSNPACAKPSSYRYSPRRSNDPSISSWRLSIATSHRTAARPHWVMWLKPKPARKVWAGLTPWPKPVLSARSSHTSSTSRSRVRPEQPPIHSMSRCCCDRTARGSLWDVSWTLMSSRYFIFSG